MKIIEVIELISYKLEYDGKNHRGYCYTKRWYQNLGEIFQRLQQVDKMVQLEVCLYKLHRKAMVPKSGRDIAEISTIRQDGTTRRSPS